MPKTVYIEIPMWLDKDNNFYLLAPPGQYTELCHHYMKLGYKINGYYRSIGFYDESIQMAKEYTTTHYNCRVTFNEA